MQLLLIFMTAVSLFMPMVAIAQERASEPLALIGNRPITQKDLDERVLSLPAKVRELYEHEQGREELLLEMVRMEIFSREAEAQGLAKDKAIQFKIQDLKKTLLASEYTKRQILAKAEVSEAEALQYYELNPDQFKRPEHIKAPSLFLKIPSSASEDAIKEIRAKAASLLARAHAGEDFIELARAHSERPFQDNVEFFKRGRLSADIEDSIFALKQGELSPLLEIQDGIVFFKMLDRQPEQGVLYADVKYDLMRDLKEKKINALFAAEEKRLLARYKVSFHKKIEKTTSVNSNQNENIKGQIVEISALQKNAEGKSLGTVMIEDKKSNGQKERFAVIVIAETVIVQQSAGKERPSSFGALKHGQSITVITQGPVMQSYPSQTRAQRIIIQENTSTGH